jgi:hypothetical protein
MWRGSRVPAAAPGSSGAYSRKFWSLTSVIRAPAGASRSSFFAV